MNSSEIKPLRETGEHSYHRRSFYHNYHVPFIYHIILKKVKACCSFGAVAGDARMAPGNPGSARIEESELGKVIAKAVIHLPYEYPIIKLHQFCVMPDHVHLLLQVMFKSEKHLDFYIEALKTKIATVFARLKRRNFTESDIFEPGYCDKPLYDNRSLNGLYRYIRENPHRLAMRKQFPQFFQRIRTLKIADGEYEAYGNLFLFRNPDKEAVKVSRSFTPAEVAGKRDTWLAEAAKGVVLVSPFISKAEKEIRTKAEAIGAKLILIIHETFPDRFKPSLHDFSLCASGRLLIISLGCAAGTPLTRSVCLSMNTLAAEICEFSKSIVNERCNHLRV